MMLKQFNVGSVCHLPPPKYYLYEQTINFSSTAHSKIQFVKLEVNN
jgi:hypothetical protein